jgi:hypothetical protein
MRSPWRSPVSPLFRLLELRRRVAVRSGVEMNIRNANFLYLRPLTSFDAGSRAMLLDCGS